MEWLKIGRKCYMNENANDHNSNTKLHGNNNRPLCTPDIAWSPSTQTRPESFCDRPIELFITSDAASSGAHQSPHCPLERTRIHSGSTMNSPNTEHTMHLWINSNVLSKLIGKASVKEHEEGSTWLDLLFATI